MSTRLGAIVRHVANRSGSQPAPTLGEGSAGAGDALQQTPHYSAAAGEEGHAAGGDALQLPQGVLDAYVADGYVLLDGLIPEDVLQRARCWRSCSGLAGSAPAG